MKICIIEDSKSLLYTLKRLLSDEKYIVRGYEDPKEALNDIATEEFNLFIVDVNLPSVDGFETVEKIRKYHPDAPVMMLTVRDSLKDKVKGFEAGADDYMTKPFEPAELVVRIKALLRRKTLDHNEKLVHEDLVLDTETKQVFWKGEEVQLSLIEFQILEYLMRHSGQTIDKDRIINMIWENPYDMSPNLVAVYVGKLRKKLSQYTGQDLIRTIRGFGYRIG